MTEEPRWLSAAELGVWMKLSVLLVRLPQELDAQLQRDAGLNWFEYLVLAGLSEAPHRTMRMSRLALLTHGSLSRLSHVVTRLEARGWVARRPCPENGRFTNATLTDAGWTKVVATAPGHVGTVRRLVTEALDATQLEQLDGVLEAVLERLMPRGCP
ncbi:MarR family winged helix-turn-helix transcriptional regulator [Geodermatophilus sp. SYSU D00814]